MFISFHVNDDSGVELSETFIVQAVIEQPSLGLFDVGGVFGLSNSTAILTILDDDGTLPGAVVRESTSAYQTSY